MPKYLPLSIERKSLSYYAHWIDEGATARVVGAYGSQSAEIADGVGGQEVAQTVLAELVEAWWAELRRTLSPGDMLPINELATGDEVIVRVERGGRRVGFRRHVEVEGGQAFAVRNTGDQDDGPARIVIDPDRASEFVDDETLRTGVWYYEAEASLVD